MQHFCGWINSKVQSVKRTKERKETNGIQNTRFWKFQKWLKRIKCVFLRWQRRKKMSTDTISWHITGSSTPLFLRSQVYGHLESSGNYLELALLFFFFTKVPVCFLILFVCFPRLCEFLPRSTCVFFFCWMSFVFKATKTCMTCITTIVLKLCCVWKWTRSDDTTTMVSW